jgi:DNA-binding MarR family transcriptional regulator
MSATHTEPAAPSVAHGCPPVWMRWTTHGCAAPLDVAPLDVAPDDGGAEGGLAVAVDVGVFEPGWALGVVLALHPASSARTVIASGVLRRMWTNRMRVASRNYYDLVVVCVTTYADGGAVPELDFRGPFLLLFALSQQQGSLLQQAMADAPLQPSEFAIYSALRLMQPITPTQLATTLGMRATTLSSALVKMERRTHLRRRRNPDDGRSVMLSLSSAGIRATERCFPAFGRAIQTFLRHLEVDQTELLRHLEAFSSALTKAAAELSAADVDRPA